MTERRRWKFLYDFFHDVPAMGGAAILVLFVLAALFAPLLAPHNPYDLTQVNMGDSLIPPAWYSGGTSSFFLGTDDRGRDILSTILFGLRTSLLVASGVVVLSGGVGVTLGLLAGYYGGKLDAVVMRLADTLFSFSSTLIAFLMLGLFKQRGVVMVIVAIAVVDWVRYARTMRGSVLELKREIYIVAAKATGCSDARILLKHLLPNALAPVSVVVAVDMAVVIMIEATLSFLGVGVPLTEPSLGMMIAIGKNYVYAGMWWMVLFPGAAMVLIVMSINLFADWLREELNPKISRRD